MHATKQILDTSQSKTLQKVFDKYSVKNVEVGRCNFGYLLEMFKMSCDINRNTKKITHS